MSHSKHSTRQVARDYLLSIVFWLANAAFIAWQDYNLGRAEQLHISFDSLLLLQTVRYLSIACLTPPVFYLVERWPLNATHVLGRAGAYVLGFVPFTLAFAVIRWCLYPPWESETQSWGARTLWSLVALAYGTFADLLLLYVGIIIAAHAYSYFTLSQRNELERADLRHALAESELYALKGQLRPHFLFNTLQGISTLIDTDRVTAKGMIVKLATLLRSALQHGSCDLVTVGEELEFLGSYLDLEAMRLGKRLQVAWRIAPRARSALIPQLILQPLVENAIVHGIACCREGGWIDIQGDCVESRLEVTIRNSVGGSSQKGLGLGIPNARARLHYLYGAEAVLDFRLEADVATAALNIPAFADISANRHLAGASAEPVA